MRLIHCADLHLDSKMDANLSSSQARERRGELLSTFVAMVEFAEQNDVYAILISGDLFDHARTTHSTEQYVLDVIAQHSEIYFFYLAGNHDFGHDISQRENLPKNLFTFGDAWKKYSIPDTVVNVYGCESVSSASFPGGESDKFNIVMLHGQYTNPSDNDYLPVFEIAKKNVNYMALGHIHSYYKEKMEGGCTVCYSGCLEGRGFDETGKKGFVLLEIEDGKLLSNQLIPIAKRTLHVVEINAENCNSQWELQQQTEKVIEQISNRDMVKLVFKGSVLADAMLDFPRLLRSFSDRFYFIKYEDKTKLKIFPADFENDISLKGEFVRQVMRSDLTEEEKEAIITCGFRALKGEELDL